MSRTLKLVAGALLLALWTAHAQAETVLKVSGTPSIFKPMFEAFVKAFEADNPDIRIALDIPPGEQEAMIQDLLRKAMINDLPDVTFQGYSYIRLIADGKLAVPLSKFIADDPDWQQGRISPSVANSGTLRGEVYGLGVGFSFPVLYYNADLVKSAQGDAPFPADWNGILTLVRKINGAKPGVVGGFMMSHSWIFQTLVESNGGRLMSDDDRKIAFDGPAGLAAFDILHRFGEAGQAAAAMTREQSRQAFVSGTVGVFTDSSSVLSKHRKEIGGKFRLGVAPFPIPAADGHVPAAGTAALMLTRDMERQRAAWRFMKFLESDEGQLIVAQNTSYVPANGMAVKRSKALAELLASEPGMTPALDTVLRASAWYAFPGKNAAKIDKLIGDMMQEVSTLATSPEAGLQSLAKTVRELL